MNGERTLPLPAGRGGETGPSPTRRPRRPPRPRGAWLLRFLLLGVPAAAGAFLLSGRLAGIADAGAPAAEAGVQSSVYEALEVFSGALMLIRDQYLDPVEPEVLMDGAVRGIFDALDPDSAYLNLEEARLYRNREALAGTIGIGLRKRYYLHVDDVLPDSPAAAAGAERGDAITAINGQSTRDLRIPVAHLLLAGAPGSTVEITLRSAADAEPRVVSLERAILAPPPVEQELMDSGVGRIRIRRFHEGTPAELEAAVASLQRSGAEALILDLRGSRGAGAGCAAGASAASLFKEEVVVEMVTRGAEGEASSPIATRSAGTVFGGPLAILVNNSTVCPGEVMAAALASRENTDLVGGRTPGRTGRPELIELPEGDAVLLSTAHLRSAGGKDILGAGVAPTLSADDLDLDPEDLDEADPGLDLALRAVERRRAALDDSA